MRLVPRLLLAFGLYTSYRYYTSSPTSTTPSHPDGRVTITRRTVAVADLHGDLQHALNVFSMASLITPSSPPTWIGGHDILVSTGDIVDRGDDTIALYRLFMSLREQARAVGGEVRQCLGNHEVMNSLGDWRYVTKGDIDSFGGVEARRAAMSTDGWLGHDWLTNYNVTQTISLLPPNHPGLPAGYKVPKASFVHGGITPHYAHLGTHHINTVGHSFLHKALSSPFPPTSWLPPNTTPSEAALWSEHGPLWYRGYATDPTPLACNHAANTTEALGVRHLVMGHTPHFDGFVTRCDNKILLIDTGISRAYGGEQSALVIDFELQPADGEREGKRRWRERETLTALYKGRLPKVLDRSERELWL